MNKVLTILFALSFIVPGFSQNPVLTFDGIDDYVNLGPDAGNGIRTIELWFKLDEEIDAQLNDFVALVAREITGSGPGINEFSLSFQPSFYTNPGKLRFDIDATEPFKSVYSDNDSWNADQWYHVAVVIDPIEGMGMFIDGIKQSSTHSYTGSTTSTKNITAIGCWGDLLIRFFKGSIDDVRFSTEALYSANFTPPCPNATNFNSTLGLWNLNQGFGIVAIDSSANSFHGQINGAIWDDAIICDSTMVSLSELHSGPDDFFEIFPNPSNGLFVLNFTFPENTPFELELINFNGQKIPFRLSPNNQIEIDQKGIFFLGLIIGEERIYKILVVQ